MTDDRRSKPALFQQATFGSDVVAQHGGRARVGKRKTSRPLEPTLPLYVLLRSSRAKGKWSLKRAPTRSAIEETLRELSQRHGIKLFAFATGADQIHLLLRAKARASFQSFLRAFAGLVARHVTGARKGKPAGRFWDTLTFSRVLQWGEEFDTVSALLAADDLDALIALNQPPKVRLKRAMNAVSAEDN
jgi:REP element-mobilizing transposase RayT